MYFVKIPEIIQAIFKPIHWKVKDSDALYLTFDDGPHPDSTPRLLQLLNENNIKASFFCLGENVASYPWLLDQIKENGHTIGIHGYEHLSGWKSSTTQYLQNVHKCKNLISSVLFRPPFGQLKYRQYRQLNSKYKIIMWHIMPGDFNDKVSALDCFNNITQNATNGSIIVLHDSVKTIDKLSKLIPELKTFYSDKFKRLPY